MSTKLRKSVSNISNIIDITVAINYLSANESNSVEFTINVHSRTSASNSQDVNIDFGLCIVQTLNSNKLYH